MSEEAFLAGYGAVQAVPGPLFTFASYLGAVMNGWTGELLATIAIFLPAFLLILGTLPYWDTVNWRLPPWMVVLTGAIGGTVMSLE